MSDVPGVETKVVVRGLKQILGTNSGPLQEQYIHFTAEPKTNLI